MRDMTLASQHAERALSAASNAALRAAREERLAAKGSRSAHIHAALADAHRGTQRRQLTAAKLQFDFAWRMAEWAARGRDSAARPVLMRAVADVLGWDGAVLILCGDSGTERLVTASDATARAAHDLEVFLGEGPSRDAIRGGATAEGTELQHRWPLWGRAVTPLGVRAVAGVALGGGQKPLGSLTVTGRTTARNSSCTLADVAEALRHSVLAPEALYPHTAGLPSLVHLDDEDFRQTLHKAAGTLSAWSGVAIDDAAALIRARAYAEERPISDVADDVLRGDRLQP